MRKSKVIKSLNNSLFIIYYELNCLEKKNIYTHECFLTHEVTVVVALPCMRVFHHTRVLLFSRPRTERFQFSVHV